MLWKATEFLYWGDMNSPLEYKQYGIRAIICVADELPTPEVDVPFLKIPVLNGHPVSFIAKGLFLRIINMLLFDCRPALVYCQAGCNRSAGLIFLYLTIIAGMSKLDAWNLMKSLRQDALSWSQDYNRIVELAE